MLYLLGEEEVYYIFDGRTVSEITDRAIKTYRSRPGFFTPYKNLYEFGGELIAPGVYPFAGLVLAGFSAFAFFASAAVCLATYLVAAGAFVFNAPELRDDALEFAGSVLYFTGVALLTSAVSALLALISFPHSVLSIVTRSMSTLGAVGTETYFETGQEKIDLEKNTDGYEFQMR
ncbi:Uncharacterised protein [Legionella steigerwaltii]|uniref:Uncharacterized protein n=1 Tax=Legionella steigerwaltii TaxID=460 RepID=A0A378L7N6_9GAMM|nr:hypothetical protein [Legionella steigerwaltii]KTD79158.1 hypothetical protein Lstg_0917 [Legionella steigerwaltii]STY22734.1 Uncharacterised protein [Legionella steigerwaltii]